MFSVKDLWRDGKRSGQFLGMVGYYFVLGPNRLLVDGCFKFYSGRVDNSTRMQYDYKYSMKSLKRMITRYYMNQI